MVSWCCRHDVVQREVKDLEKGIAHLHNCMARYNALIADNAALKVQLVNDNFHLETKIGHNLQVWFQGVTSKICVYHTRLIAVLGFGFQKRCLRGQIAGLSGTLGIQAVCSAAAWKHIALVGKFATTAKLDHCLTGRLIVRLIDEPTE